MKKTYLLSLMISMGIFFVFSSVLFRLTSYLHPIVLLVVFFCLFSIILAILLSVRKETIHISFSLLKIILVVYTVTLLILLFFRPNEQPYHSWNLIPFSTISYFLSGKVNGLVAFYNLAANIGLFIPYGIFLMIRKIRSTLFLILVPIVAISGIEILQLITHRGSLDIDDLILNLCGVFIGYWASPFFKKIVHILEKI